MNTHTPGPWDLHFGLDYVRVLKQGGTTDDLIAQVYGDDRDEERANALLLQAAPDLLEALRLCVTNAECAAEYAGQKGNSADTLTLLNAPNWPGIVLARAIIKKATG